MTTITTSATKTVVRRVAIRTDQWIAAEVKVEIPADMNENQLDELLNNADPDELLCEGIAAGLKSVIKNASVPCLSVVESTLDNYDQGVEVQDMLVSSNTYEITA